MAAPLSIGIAACEPSGDHLGKGLMQALQRLQPDIRFAGIAGPEMRAAGCETLARSEQISTMGLVEVLGKLPSLYRLRQQVARRFLGDPPDLFVGIDAPDFNFGLEKRLKRAAVPIVHYVSPSLWAWREGRVNRIAGTVDLMLTLLPFEPAFYQRHHVAAEFVGHPLADEIPEQTDQQAARQMLGLEQAAPVLALLPGSRSSELRHLLALFVETAQRCQQAVPELQLLLPAADAAGYRQILDWLDNSPSSASVRLLDGQAQTAMAAADIVLVASGTATLECLLVGRPMVVAYKMHPLSYRLIKRSLRVPHVSLPNLLAGRALVPEFLQDQARPEALSQALLDLLDKASSRLAQTTHFAAIRDQLTQGASERAARQILRQWEGCRVPGQHTAN